jgi:hypothetical protein
MYFSYQENQAAVISVQRATVVALATSIEQSIRETEHQIGWVVVPADGVPVTVEQRRADYLRLLRQAPAVRQLRYLDGMGNELLRVGRPSSTTMPDQTARIMEAALSAAESGQPYFGPVYVEDGATPAMTIAIADGPARSGVTVAEVTLTSVWEAVAQVRIGRSGYAYAVDQGGRLIAHPDTALAVQQPDRSSALAVVATRAGPLQGRQTYGDSGVVDPVGPSVMVVSELEGQRFPGDLGQASDHLVAYAQIQDLGWTVFVDQPLEEAFGSVRAAIVRTVLLLLMGLVLSVLASLYLVRTCGLATSSKRWPSSSMRWPRSSGSRTRTWSRRSRTGPARWRRRAASWSWRASTRVSFWPTCHTSCGPHSTPSWGSPRCSWSGCLATSTTARKSTCATS